MDDAERDLLDWAILAGGVLGVPPDRTADDALLALVAKGVLIRSERQLTSRLIRYEVTEAAGYVRAVERHPLPPLPPE